MTTLAEAREALETAIAGLRAIPKAPAATPYIVQVQGVPTSFSRDLTQVAACGFPQATLFTLAQATALANRVYNGNNVSAAPVLRDQAIAEDIAALLQALKMTEKQP